MRKLFGCNIEQHIATLHVALRPPLGEISHRRGEFALRPTELLEQHLGKERIRRVHTDGVHHFLIMEKHSAFYPLRFA